jgi:hypothetical protein
VALKKAECDYIKDNIRKSNICLVYEISCLPHENNDWAVALRGLIMSEDKQAQSEAWVRKKKRIIHNQWLIRILLILSLIVPIPASGIILWLFFVAFPPIILQSVLALWFASSVAYASLRVYFWHRAEKQRV